MKCEALRELRDVAELLPGLPESLQVGVMDQITSKLGDANSKVAL